MNQFKDVLFLFANYVSLSDLLNFSSTCRDLRHMIIDLVFWKRILFSKHSSDLWINVTFDNVLEIIQLLFKHKKDKSVLDNYLKYKFILFRLSEPQTSKNHAKFYAKIVTESLPNENKQEILVGNLLTDENEHTKNYKGFFLRFKKLNGQSSYYWNGEDNHNSSTIFYLLDRKVIGSVTDMNAIDIRPKFHNTILGKKDYKNIGKILHNDENYYQDFKSTSFNPIDSHSSQRFHTERFGQNSNSTSYQNINVSCLTHIDIFLSTNYAFSLIKT